MSEVDVAVARLSAERVQALRDRAREGFLEAERMGISNLRNCGWNYLCVWADEDESMGDANRRLCVTFGLYRPFSPREEEESDADVERRDDSIVLDDEDLTGEMFAQLERAVDDLYRTLEYHRDRLERQHTRRREVRDQYIARILKDAKKRFGESWYQGPGDEDDGGG